MYPFSLFISPFLNSTFSYSQSNFICFLCSQIFLFLVTKRGKHTQFCLRILICIKTMHRFNLLCCLSMSFGVFRYALIEIETFCLFDGNEMNFCYLISMLACLYRITNISHVHIHAFWIIYSK